MQEVPKDTEEAQRTVELMNQTLGFDIRQVLDEDDWVVAMVDGRPDIMVNKAGVRKMALFAPDQERAARVVDWVESL